MTDVATRDDVARVSALFTRGAMDAPDLRGDSMVTKHLEKLQQEKEKQGFAKMQALHPSIGPTVCAIALEEADWVVEAAHELLSRFEEENKERIALLLLKKDGLLKAASAVQAKLIGGHMATASVSADGKKRKHSSRHDKHSEHKKHKSDKHGKAKAGIAGHVASDQYGRYGIIREADLATKVSEFQQWATEVKKVNIEALPKWEEKELFAEFMEDYNTGTLPHKKYYDLMAYAQQQAMKAAKKGRSTGKSEKTMFDDEEERRREIAVMRAADQEDRLKQAYNELKYTAPDKAADMREQDMLRMQMQMAYRTGDHDTANKLAERLKPDEQKEAEAARRPDN
ncbi:MAG: hypothetical protein FRX49_08242 [Trebouxia sp. A1-2]|nr:MAG: hypothetical protein FRX49_08242 [Trebouxia sp. A1-2]